jgi:hypothetical protein
VLVEREVKKEAARAETVQREKVSALVDDHEDRLDDLEKRLPGSKAKIDGATNAKVAPHIARLILESDKSALLQLHLAERPDKLAELNRMSPVQAAREAGRLEARLSLPKPRTETKAPPPVRSPKGGASPSSPRLISRPGSARPTANAEEPSGATAARGASLRPSRNGKHNP